MDILNQVNKDEESRLNKKIERQNAIKKIVYDKERRSAEKKKNKINRLEEIKSQLRQGHRLGDSPKRQGMLFGSSSKNKSKKAKRTISTINREWSAAVDDSASPSSDATEKASDRRSRKT
ncbi:hypothetical protein LPJ64_005827, partial [Coemansia asiatica]